MKTLDAARGKWTSILTQLGVDASALDGRHKPCPCTGQGTDRFRYANQNGSGNFFCHCQHGRCSGISLLMCKFGWTFQQAASEVDKIIGNVKPDMERAMPDPLPRLQKAWKASKPAGFAVRRYLKNRGLICPPSVREIRQQYFDGDKRMGFYDCMVGVIETATGERASLHLTYIKDGAKADVPSPRKVLPPARPITGGAIRLFPQADTIGIAEGIETAIAAHMLFSLPVWSVVNRNGIETFVPPEGVKRVVIYGDRDESYAGQAGAYRAAERLARLVDVEVVLPDVGDFNDVLRKRA